MKLNSLKIAGAIFLSTLIIPPAALAYLDPGTGSMIIQALAVAVFSSLFFIKRIWHSIKKFFGRNKDE